MKGIGSMENYINVSELGSSKVFEKTRRELDQKFQFKCSEFTQDFTAGAFVTLYQITREYFEKHFSELVSDYVPIYISMWKLSLKELLGVKNMHQDGGINYFAKNGYAARMKTLWTNLYKDSVETFDESDMGIYTVDCEKAEHQGLYERMAQYNTHFFQFNDHKLCDMRQLGDISIDYDLNTLKRDYYPFKEGTTIQFNSRLLHGSKAVEQDAGAFDKKDLNRFRVALTSVWLHKDDLDEDVVAMPEQEDDELFLSACERTEWPRIKQERKAICDRERLRLRLIRDLVSAHRNFEKNA